MENLARIKCAACEGGVDPLTPDQYAPYLEQVAEWSITNNKMLERVFEFKDFAQALGFVNAVGEIAEDEGHHPDLLLHSWNKVKVSLWTHAIGGLSINDFIVATKVNLIKSVQQS
jgi:4a-hydroxytetrahydrobiopterin dehydratase